MAEALMKEQVLIVAPNWIGDAVLSLPVVDGCRRLWPEAELTILARPGIADIFRTGRPEIPVIEYRRARGLGRLRNIIRLGRSLGRQRFSLALILPNSLSSALLVWIARIPDRVGYATDGRGVLLTHGLASRQKERGLHQVDYYLELIRASGAREIVRTPLLQVKQETVDAVIGRWAEMGVDRRQTMVGVHPGAAYGVAKRWFPERFAAVIDRLQGPGRQVILFGARGEEALAEKICGNLTRPVVNLVGRTTVAEALALIASCSLFISNDSGLMHVAAALAVPQVALFGSTDPEKTAPLNERAVVIHPAEVECTPCFRRDCPRDLECMRAITVDQVHQAAERLLRG